MEEEQKDCSSPNLTAEQKQLIQKNRERACEVRERKKRVKPYDRPANTPNELVIEHPPPPVVGANSRDHSTALQNAGLRNSHAGFMFDEEDDDSCQQHTYHRVEEEAPVLPNELMRCGDCQKHFAVSYLQSKFQLSVCDKCKDSSGKHSLITKTEAKKRYSLQDRDFEERNGDPLPYLLKKNPHSMQWGEMKLYLVCQVEARSHEIWGGEEGLMEEQRKKIERREKRKENNYAKEIKALRKAVKSSMTKSSSETSHVHSFPGNEEVYDSEEDSWTKTCSECGFQVTFEKL